MVQVGFLNLIDIKRLTKDFREQWKRLNKKDLLISYVFMTAI